MNLSSVDDLLHKMNVNNMHIGDRQSIRLTKHGDCLEESIDHLCKYLQENPNMHYSIVLLAGTSDLLTHQAGPELLVDPLADCINKLRQYDMITEPW